MCYSVVVWIKHHAINNSFYYADHAFPWSSEMRRMWGVEHPLDSRVEQVLFCFFHLQHWFCLYMYVGHLLHLRIWCPDLNGKSVRKALINADELSESITSMCMARMTRHVKSTPHRFEEALPPRVFRETTCHGPKTSTQSLVKGGFGSSLFLWNISHFPNSFFAS